MSRKEKKRKRKAKSFAPKQIKFPKAVNEFLWKWAKEVSQIRPKKSEVNKHVYCPTCEQQYCLGFDNVDQFCRDCFYNHCCTKEMIGRRVCQRCRRQP